jgi:hypothetical protein
VRMREHHCMHVFRAHGQLGIDLSRLLSSALIGTAIEKESLTAHCHFVHGPGHGLGGAPERDLHLNSIAHQRDCKR